MEGHEKEDSPQLGGVGAGLKTGADMRLSRLSEPPELRRPVRATKNEARPHRNLPQRRLDEGRERFAGAPGGAAATMARWALRKRVICAADRAQVKRSAPGEFASRMKVVTYDATTVMGDPFRVESWPGALMSTEELQQQDAPVVVIEEQGRRGRRGERGAGGSAITRRRRVSGGV